MGRGEKEEEEEEEGGEEEEGLLEAALKVGGAHVAAPQGALHVLLEEPPVALQHLCGLLVQGVLGIRLLMGEEMGGGGGEIRGGGGGRRGGGR